MEAYSLPWRSNHFRTTLEHTPGILSTFYHNSTELNFEDVRAYFRVTVGGFDPACRRYGNMLEYEILDLVFQGKFHVATWQLGTSRAQELLHEEDD
jgi:hypothetical protein